MRIRIFLRPEQIVRLLSSRGKDPAWLRIRIGTPESTFSELMAKKLSPSGHTVKRIMYYMRGAKWDDIFTVKTDED